MRGMGTPQIPLKYSPNLGQGPKEYQFFWQHPLLTFEKKRADPAGIDATFISDGFVYNL